MILGIFIGGRSTRMGGQPKGLLPAPDGGQPLVVRLAGLARQLGMEPVLVGDAAAYTVLLPELRVLHDHPEGIGPLGGLLSLLEAAAPGPVLAVACDMPYVSRELLARLVNAETAAPVLAARTGERWQPLCARYDAGALCVPLAAALAHGIRSFQRLFETLAVEELVLDEVERAQLVDWDTPEDLHR